MATKTNPTPKATEIAINVNAVVGTKLAHGILTYTTETDVTFDFVYLHPRGDKNADVVSRVTLPISTAKQFAKDITEAIQKQDAKSKE